MEKWRGIEEMMEMIDEDNFSFAASEVERSGQNGLQGLVRRGIIGSDGTSGAMLVVESNVGCQSCCGVVVEEGLLGRSLEPTMGPLRKGVFVESLSSLTPLGELVPAASSASSILHQSQIAYNS